jgi:hypothetical protein
MNFKMSQIKVLNFRKASIRGPPLKFSLNSIKIHKIHLYLFKKKNLGTSIFTNSVKL